MDFTRWNKRLLQAVENLTYKLTRPAIIIDAMIPYRLGWSVERTARAILCLNIKDTDYLCGLKKGNDKDGAGHKPC